MKTILLLFSIVLICSGASIKKGGRHHHLGGSSFLERSTFYGRQESLDTHLAQTDPQVRANLDFGVQQLLQTLQDQAKIENTDFEVTAVNEVKMQIVGRNTNYEFKVELNNNQGSVIKAAFKITNRLNGEKVLGSWSFSMTTRSTAFVSTVPDEDAWEQVSLEAYQASAEMESALQYGIDQAIAEAERKGELLIDSLDIAKINDIYQQTVNAFKFYKFNVDLENNQGVSMTLNCQIAINTRNGDKTLRSYHYVATTTLYAERIKIVNTNEGYIEITQSEIESDKNVQTALDYGVRQIVNLIIGEGRVTDSSFQVTDIYRCQTRVLGEWTFYKFDVILKNSENTVVTTTFTVRCHNRTKECSLTGFEYTVNTQYTDGDDSGEGKYIYVEKSEIDEDSQAKGALDAAVTEILSEAARDSKISSINFRITRILACYKKIVSGGIYYKFDLELEDDEGTTITLSLTIRYRVQTGQSDVRSYSYTVRTASQEAGEYVDIDEATATSDEQAKTAIEFGVDEVVKKVARTKNLDNTNFSINRYISIQRSISRTYAFYRCNLELTNGAGGTITTTFTVKINIRTEACELSAFTYRYSFRGTTSRDESDYESDEEETEGEYTEINEAQLTTNDDVKRCYEYGLNEIIQKILKKKDIENTDFTISNAISIKKKTSGDWIYCSFDLELSNGEGWTITTKFTVKCNLRTRACSLTSYNYKYNFDGNWSAGLEYSDVAVSRASSDSQLQTAVSFGTDEIVKKYADKARVTTGLRFTNSRYNSIQRAITKTYGFYKFDLELTNSAGVTIYATFSVKCQTRTSQCELSSFSFRYTTKRVSNNDESDFLDTEEEGSYNDISTVQVTTNDEVKTAVNYGISQITQKVAQKKDISSTGFTISRVNSVKKQLTVKWIYYKFDLILVNTNGWTITTTFTVRCNARATSECSLKSYHYTVTYTEPPVEKITATQIDKDADAKAAMDFGVEEVTKKLKDQGIISSLNFRITKVEEGEIKRKKNGIAYTFNLELTGPYDFLVKVSITVFHNTKTGVRSLDSWSLKGTSSVAQAASNAASAAVSSATSAASSWFSSIWK